MSSHIRDGMERLRARRNAACGLVPRRPQVSSDLALQVVDRGTREWRRVVLHAANRSALGRFGARRCGAANHRAHRCRTRRSTGCQPCTTGAEASGQRASNRSVFGRAGAGRATLRTSVPTGRLIASRDAHVRLWLPRELGAWRCVPRRWWVAGGHLGGPEGPVDWRVRSRVCAPLIRGAPAAGHLAVGVLHRVVNPCW